jgi:hypothetical protein
VATWVGSPPLAALGFDLRGPSKGLGGKAAQAIFKCKTQTP